MMDEAGEIEASEAQRWKEGIYGLMVLWGLEPDEVVAGPNDPGNGGCLGCDGY